MKILIVSQLRRRLGPNVTASRSQVIYNLAEGLIKLGHQVSIIASKDSQVKGVTIIPIIEKSLNELPPFENQFYAETAYLVLMARKIQEIASKFDIIHNHVYPEYISLLIENTLPVPMVTTLHAPVTEELKKVLSCFPKSNLVAQSQAYKRLMKGINIQWVVSNGVDPSFFTYSEGSRDYLLWVGRLGKAQDAKGDFMDGKGVKEAILVARKAGKKLLLVGNIEDSKFYEKEVFPYLSDQIKWISPLSSEQSLSKSHLKDLLHKAKALLFPTKFEESFGLVACEAMSCGTPVIAYARGSLKEIIKDGKTGFLVNPSDGVKGLCEAVEQIYSMAEADYQKMQKAGRTHVEQNFTIDKMVRNYEALYKRLIKGYN